MHFLNDTKSEGIRISFDDLFNGLSADLFMLFIVLTASTVAVLTVLPTSKAFTVQL